MFQFLPALALLGITSARVLPLQSDVSLNPHRVFARDGCTYDDCPVDDKRDAGAVCGHDVRTFNDRLIASNVWYETGTAIWLDDWLSTNYYDKDLPPDDWLAELNQRYSDDQTDNSIWDCATVDEGNCQVSASCGDYWDLAVPELYYINFAAMQCHTAFATLHKALQDWTIATGFNAQDIADDFGEGEAKGLNPFATIGAAFGIASGAAFAVGPISGALGIIAGSFGIASQFFSQAEPPDPEAALQDQIGDYFDSARQGIENTLVNAFGIGEYNVEDLPAQTEESVHWTHIAQFFADGKFLMYNTEEVMDPIIEHGNQLMMGGLGVAVLKSLGYWIFVDAAITSEEDCYGPSRSFRWYDQCFRLQRTYPGCSENAPSCGEEPWYIDDALWDKLVDSNGKYKVDPAQLYSTAYDCKRAYPDGSGAVDGSSIIYDGTIPRCFYSMDVVKGEWNYPDPISEWPL